MLRAIPAVGDVLLVAALIYFIFAVMAVNLLVGGMHSCTDTSSGSPLDAYYLLPKGEELNETWCQQGDVSVSSSYYHSAIGQEVPAWNVSMEWQAPLVRFDDVAQAMWTLFQVSTGTHWVFKCVREHLQLKTNHTLWRSASNRWPRLKAGPM